MNKEIKDILNELKNSIKEPATTEIDNFTEEAYEYPNFFVLDPTTNECKALYNYITNLQKENKRLYELCMYALISSTKIYNHELAIITKQAFIQIIKENLQEDTFAIRDKIKKYWETGDK